MQDMGFFDGDVDNDDDVFVNVAAHIHGDIHSVECFGRVGFDETALYKTLVNLMTKRTVAAALGDEGSKTDLYNLFINAKQCVEAACENGINTGNGSGSGSGSGDGSGDAP